MRHLLTQQTWYIKRTESNYQVLNHMKIICKDQIKKK
jgi:hypothetical protein